MKKMIIFLFVVSPVFAQIVNHSYPRIGQFQFGSGTVDYHARFDLINTGQTSTSFATAVKSINPDAIILPTRDWNAGPFSYGYTIPDEWKTRHSDGSFVNLYTSDDFYMDVTNYCPPATSGTWSGLRYNQAVAEWHAGLVNLNYYDGLSTDGLWNSPNSANGDIDLDRNGLNDFDEVGKGDAWISARIEEGIDVLLTNVRNIIGTDHVILINSGGMHTWGWTETNGMLKEHSVFFYSLGDVTYNLDTYLDFIAAAPSPHVVLIDGEPTTGVIEYDANAPQNTFKHMQFWLGFTLMGDGYFSYSPDEQHMYTLWYDEFEIDLGYPTTAAYKLRNGLGDEGGLWIRFFQNGVVLFNGTGTDQSVQVSDISGLTGYDGPYYHFRGGQDPTVNDGAQFSSESIYGDTLTLGGNSGSVAGTSLIMLKTASDVVADIIIDNWRHGTLPGNDMAIFSGQWTNMPTAIDQSGGEYYSLRDRYFEDPGDPATLYGYAYTAAGSGADSVVFRPTIGLAGYYRVYEWHGYLGVSPTAITEATNASYKVHHAGGISTVAVNQSINFGQWNLLGEYQFNAGETGYVGFNNNVNGSLMADAIKFDFQGATAGDTQPPAAPHGFRVTQ